MAKNIFGAETNTFGAEKKNFVPKQNAFGKQKVFLYLVPKTNKIQNWCR
jgi:hypothetical protein